MKETDCALPIMNEARSLFLHIDPASFFSVAEFYGIFVGVYSKKSGRDRHSKKIIISVLWIFAW